MRHPTERFGPLASNRVNTHSQTSVGLIWRFTRDFSDGCATRAAHGAALRPRVSVLAAEAAGVVSRGRGGAGRQARFGVWRRRRRRRAPPPTWPSSGAACCSPTVTTPVELKPFPSGPPARRFVWGAFIAPVLLWTQRSRAPGAPRLVAATPLLAANLAAPLLFTGREVLSCFTVAVATAMLTNLKIVAWITGRGALALHPLNLPQWMAVYSLPITPSQTAGGAGWLLQVLHSSCTAPWRAPAHLLPPAPCRRLQCLPPPRRLRAAAPPGRTAARRRRRARTARPSLSSGPRAASTRRSQVGQPSWRQRGGPALRYFLTALATPSRPPPRAPLLRSQCAPWLRASHSRRQAWRASPTC